MYDELQLLQIIEGCRQGRATSEEALFRRFAPKVMAIARRYAADEPQALDYLQECFVVIFDKVNLFEPAKGGFEPWAHRICINVILQIIRKNKTRHATVELPEELPDGNIWETDMELPDTTQILDIIRQLPPGYREVFNLHLFEKWPHQDIAASLGISESSSRSQLTRAKKWLKQKLQQVTHHYEQGLV